MVETASERELPAGWVFELRVVDADGGTRMVTLSLSWADYNLWSASGGDTPSAVAEAVVMFLGSRGGASSLRDKFDASLVRRLHPDADAALPGFIRPG
jgi:hypothetical protein